ncbi:hypothetical protein C0992_005137, partial [Termitomyces sp. T32_za158]
MMHLTFAFVSLLATSLAALSPPASHHVVHETRAADPIDWQIARRLEHDKVLPMRFGLRQQNLHRIEEMLLAVSHPESPSYGQHLTPSEVVETFAPSGDTIAAVANWLTDAGISRERLRLSISKGWIDLNATVEEMEDLLKAEYHVYSHLETGDEQIGCTSYSVPAHVQPHVELIKPTVHFRHRSVSNRFNKRGMNLGAPSVAQGPKLSTKKIDKALSLSTCDEFTTLDCLHALYSVNYTPVSTDKNSYGIESDLDLEYAMGLTNPQPITLLQTGDIVEGASFNNWLDAVDGSYCTFEGGDVPGQ